MNVSGTSSTIDGKTVTWDENGHQVATVAEYNRMFGRHEYHVLRQPKLPYRVVGNSPVLDGRLSEFQACKSAAAAAKSASMAQGKRFRMTNVRVVRLSDVAG